MFVLLLRQRVRLFWNHMVRGPRRVRRIASSLLALIVGLAFVTAAGLNAGSVVDRLDTIDPALAGSALALLLVGIAVLTLVTSMSSAFHHLFLGSDLELLLAAPLPARSLFWLKVLEIWRDAIHVLLFQAAALIGYGRGLHVGWIYYPLALVAGLVLSIGASALGAVLTLLLARVRFGESILGLTRLLSIVIFVAVGVVGVPAAGPGFGQRTRISLFVSQADVQSMAAALRAIGPPPTWAPTTWAAHLLVGDEAAPLSAVLLLLTAGIAVALSGTVFETLFQGGWERVRFSGPSRGSSRAASLTAAPAAPRGGLRIAGPVLGILQKDWRTLVRDPRWRTNAVISLVALGLPALLLFAGDPFARAQHATRFWFGMLPVPYLAYLLGSQQGAATLAYEGRNLTLLRAAPVGMGRVLVAKALGGLGMVMLVTWAATLLLGVRHAGEPVEMGTALVAATWLALGATVAAVAGAALTVELDVDNPQRRVGCFGTVVTGSLSLFFFVSNTGLLLWWVARATLLGLPRPLLLVVPVIDVALPVLAALSVAALGAAWVAGARRLADSEFA
jgi:ABC-2 type transport system permease protein